VIYLTFYYRFLNKIPVEKEALNETEYYGGNHKMQDIKTCGSADHREGGDVLGKTKIYILFLSIVE
jgi:hypothetical protein